MKKASLLIPLLILVLSSCQKEKIKIDSSNPLLGTWNQTSYFDNGVMYIRSNAFADSPCYKFNSDGTLTERKNSSSCGTPPVLYGDYTGTWTIIKDSVLEIKSGYWGGEMTFRWKIDLVDDTNLRLSYLVE
jgi:hypothetical protein